jgi:hypothetical protein
VAGREAHAVNKNPWRTIVGDRERPDEAAVAATRAGLLKRWASHPLYWLTAVDPTTTTGEGLGGVLEGKEFPRGRPVVWTIDERDASAPAKPFPRDWEYLFRYIADIHRLEKIIVDKSRQMYVSTATLLYLDYLCRFVPGRLCVLSKSTEEQAAAMLNDKVRRMHTMLPEWLRRELPLRPRPRQRLPYPKTQSAIVAANEEAANRIARGNTASVMVIDEAAYQNRCGEIVAAVLPMASKLILISTANIGNPGARVMQHYMERESA